MTAVHAIIENVSRRGFLKGLLATGGLVVAAQFVPARAFAYATGAEKMPHGVRSDPRLFVSIAPDGTVTIVAIRSEMGTGSRTSLPMIVADELGADWSRVRVVQAPGDEEKYGNQDTDGSRSLRHHIQPMRQCGAAARQMIETAAASRWGVAVAEVQAQNHEVVHRASGRKLGYGELAAAASALPTPPADQIKLKDASAFRYIGKGTTPIVDLFAGSAGIPAGAHPAPLLTRSWRSPCPFQHRTAERYKGGCDPALTLLCEMGPRVRIRFPPGESQMRTSLRLCEKSH